MNSVPHAVLTSVIGSGTPSLAWGNEFVEISL